MAIKISLEDLNIINDAWDRLLQLVHVRKSDFKLADALNTAADVNTANSEAIATNAARTDDLETWTVTNKPVTTEAMTLYVDAAGNDGNPGTIGSPLLTIQAAVNKVPKIIRHPVLINVGAGTFDGFAIDNFDFDMAQYATYLRITGTLADFTTASGPNSGTATGATVGTIASYVYGTLTLTGAAWTVNNLKGKLLHITGGGGYNAAAVVPTQNTFVIVANTAEIITVAGTLPSGVDNTTTFTIQDWATHVTPTCDLQATNSTLVATPDYCCIQINGIKQSVNASIALYNLFLDNTTGLSKQGIYGDFGYLIASNIYSLDLSVGVNPVSWSATGRISITNWVFKTVTPAITYTLLCSFNSNASVVFYLYGCIYDVPATATLGRLLASNSPIGNYHVTNSLISVGAAIPLSYGGFITFSGCRITSSNGSGLFTASANSGPLYLQISNCDINNIATVCNVGSAINFVRLDHVVGGTNTTLINAANGANVFIDSTSTITGTTEILLDGVAKTLAEMRAQNPKYLNNATTGTRVWGD